MHPKIEICLTISFAKGATFRMDLIYSQVVLAYKTVGRDSNVMTQ